PPRSALAPREANPTHPYTYVCADEWDFGGYRRFSLRQTTRRPDQMSVTAHTLLSTRPSGRNTSRTVSSVMSVGTFGAFFGPQIHSPPSTSSPFNSFGTSRSSSARDVWNESTTSLVAPLQSAGRSR